MTQRGGLVVLGQPRRAAHG